MFKRFQKDQHRSRIILITGASSGIGRACAYYLGREGHQVYGTSRFPEDHMDESGIRPFELLEMDVSSSTSVQQAVETVLTREQRIDVLINNAGISLVGPVELTSLEEARAIIDTNFFGAFLVTKAILPTMREQRSGRIINISSLGGLVGLPYQAFYSASKFALEAMSEALSMEVQPFGVDVVLIEPGNVATPIGVRRVEAEQTQEEGAYTESYRTALEAHEKQEARGISAEEVAHLVGRIVKARAPRLRYTVGHATERAIMLRRLFPWPLIRWSVMKSFDMS